MAQWVYRQIIFATIMQQYTFFLALFLFARLCHRANGSIGSFFGGNLGYANCFYVFFSSNPFVFLGIKYSFSCKIHIFNPNVLLVIFFLDLTPFPEIVPITIASHCTYPNHWFHRLTSESHFLLRWSIFFGIVSPGDFGRSCFPFFPQNLCFIEQLQITGFPIDPILKSSRS